MFQLVMQDEYGTRNIIGSFEDLDALEEQAKKLVNQENMDNALTTTEQLLDWNTCWPEFFDDEGDQVQAVYAGCKGVSDHLVYIGDDGEEFHLDSLDVTPRFYIGEFTKDRQDKGGVEYYYAEAASAKNPRNKEIVEDFNHQLIRDKVIFFAKKV